ncbi:Pseudouridine synthase, partial [human gut metagenome]
MNIGLWYKEYSKKKRQIYTDKIGRDRHDRRKRLVDNKNGQYAETQVNK